MECNMLTAAARQLVQATDLLHRCCDPILYMAIPKGADASLQSLLPCWMPRIYMHDILGQEGRISCTLPVRQGVRRMSTR